MVKCWLQWSGVSEAADLGPVDVEVVGVERGHLQTVQVLQKFLDFIWKFFWSAANCICKITCLNKH